MKPRSKPMSTPSMALLSITWTVSQTGQSTFIGPPRAYKQKDPTERHDLRHPPCFGPRNQDVSSLDRTISDLTIPYTMLNT